MDKEIYKTNLISLTPKALERLRFLLKSSEEKDNAIRLGVKNGGCAGMAYTLDYIKDVRGNDEVIK